MKTNNEFKTFKKPFIEERVCIVCGKLFYRRIKKRTRHKNAPGIRKSGSLVCSKECAKERINLQRKGEI